MKLQDALYNWLQMEIVAQARPEDRAAGETLSFFREILREDHGVSDVAIERSDETMYYVRYETADQAKVEPFRKEWVDRLLSDIESNPKYNQRYE